MVPSTPALLYIYRYRLYIYISVNSKTGFGRGKTCPEDGRDLKLDLKLVSWSGKKEDEPEVHFTKGIPVWIKAALNEKHLLLPQRRKPKGENYNYTYNARFLFYACCIIQGPWRNRMPSEGGWRSHRRPRRLRRSMRVRRQRIQPDLDLSKTLMLSSSVSSVSTTTISAKKSKPSLSL